MKDGLRGLHMKPDLLMAVLSNASQHWEGVIDLVSSLLLDKLVQLDGRSRAVVLELFRWVASS